MDFPAEPTSDAEARRRLKGVKEAAGWRDKDLAEYFEVSRVTVSNWMRGETPVPSMVRRAIPMLERFVQQQERERWRDVATRALGAGVVFGSALLYEYLKGSEEEEEDQKRADI